MIRQPVASGNIESVGYDSRTGTLEIEFRGSGAVYQYFAVPVQVYDEFMKSFSLGSHFAQFIRPCYQFKQVVLSRKERERAAEQAKEDQGPGEAPAAPPPEKED